MANSRRFSEPDKHARDVLQGTRGRKSDKVMLTGTLREKGTQTDKFQVSHYQLPLKILSCSCYLEVSHASQSYEDINTTSNDSCKCIGNDNNSFNSKERRL